MRKIEAGDLSGAVADLGILVPLAAGLVLVTGLAPGPLLIGAGALAVAAGLYFKVPFPVQPLKALTALAIAQELSPDVIHAAGLEIGLFFVLLSVTGGADALARFFTKPVIRSLQFGVGTLLVVAAVKMAYDPPASLEPSNLSGTTLLLLSAGVCIGVAIASRYRWNAFAALVVVAGTVLGWTIAAPDLGSVAFELPSVGLPPLSAFGTAFVLLVIPQIPLTYGNAVVGLSDLANETFGPGARRVTPRAVALSCGLGNLASSVLGGMPMCHGSSGFSAHVRLGARTNAMNVVLGGVLITLGLVFSHQVVALFGVLPIWALAGFLAYAGLRHALLVLDLPAQRMVLAIACGLVGVVTGNLVYTTALALLIDRGTRFVDGRARRRSGERATSAIR
jgi:SulP family sulfate permease